ncbi:MAG: VOC family protein [Bacteroidetes bacterium B1(2017)]|nr:MAG: VOC family protein [Bacteroidetes bacterium B1(2017)]
MTQLNSYLTFNGNCREAMTFYKECLGGDLLFQTIGASPLASQLPEEMKECILHSTLTHQGFVLMGSDMAPGSGLVKGNAVSLMLNCISEADINTFFQKLSQDGKVKHQLEHTFWGALFGDLTDKYGNNWILNYEKELNTKKL